MNCTNTLRTPEHSVAVSDMATGGARQQRPSNAVVNRPPTLSRVLSEVDAFSSHLGWREFVALSHVSRSVAGAANNHSFWRHALKPMPVHPAASLNHSLTHKRAALALRVASDPRKPWGAFSHCDALRVLSEYGRANPGRTKQLPTEARAPATSVEIAADWKPDWARELPNGRRFAAAAAIVTGIASFFIAGSLVGAVGAFIFYCIVAAVALKGNFNF
jgi:hypothetical protein